MKDLYLMRHGETLFNQRRKIQGWCDSPLTEKGIEQAQKAGELTEYQEKLYQNLRDEIERKQSEENYASIETQLKVLENDLNTMVSGQKKTQ